jgi:hypothetical protein
MLQVSAFLAPQKSINTVRSHQLTVSNPTPSASNQQTCAAILLIFHSPSDGNGFALSLSDIDIETPPASCGGMRSHPDSRRYQA